MYKMKGSQAFRGSRLSWGGRGKPGRDPLPAPPLALSQHRLGSRHSIPVSWISQARGSGAKDGQRLGARKSPDALHHAPPPPTPGLRSRSGVCEPARLPEPPRPRERAVLPGRRVPCAGRYPAPRAATPLPGRTLSSAHPTVRRGPPVPSLPLAWGPPTFRAPYARKPPRPGCPAPRPPHLLTLLSWRPC